MRTIPSDTTLNHLISSQGGGDSEKHYRVKMLEGGREHRKRIEKLIYKYKNERQQMTTGGAHRGGGEGGHSERPTSASPRCPEHWPLCRGFFCTRLLFGCPISVRRSLIPLHWLRGESTEVRWLGWSWLLGILLTDTQNFRRARQKTAQRSFWGKGRSPKPWVLCNLIQHSVLYCICSFQRQMYPSEVRYFACVTALFCPFWKRWTRWLMKWGSEPSRHMPGKGFQIPPAMGSAWCVWHPGEHTRTWDYVDIPLIAVIHVRILRM